ncbi:SAM-dependent methyltransferase [Veronia nyctiphanis]|uniref:SAM-dependent methyltransferase n=1 Tax=Veronia nyctiphanis TaxID=1278244 RepID=A0A4Q0YS33_9GAMM|nr:class I SAM-dependent methyltransferase [Veronia nyctiphanis]RXJ74017.1 SAM-dependent methyltransferase [Veronia nyctiphanis]
MTLTKHSWDDYYKAVTRRPHDPMTEIAIAKNRSGSNVAVDAGCGAGTEAEFLAKVGYDVYAFDPEDGAIELCRRRFLANKNVKVFRDSFETFTYPKNGLFIAKSSLFFCDPKQFERVWSSIEQSIEPGGVFFGQLLGGDDSWQNTHVRHISKFSKQQALAKLSAFDLLEFKEVHQDGKTAVGTEKFWHVFTFLAIKR